MRESEHIDRQQGFLWIIAVIVAMFVIFGLGEALMGDKDPPNNEPYTGVCLEPTPQLGC